MTKKLVIVAAMMTFCGGAMAQDEGTSSGGGFFSGMSLNTNNKYQISLLLGNQTMFDQSLTYLIPNYSNDASVGIGLPGPNSLSEDPGTYIRFKDLGEGNLMNMAGIQFTYYLFDGLDLNASFGMDLRSTPKKDFVEGEAIKDMAIQEQKYIEGQFKNNWLLTLGGNYHFTVSNEKIDMYAGLQFGYQHGHINTYTPYTDADYAYLVSSEFEKTAQAAATAFTVAKGAYSAAEASKNVAESYKDSWSAAYTKAKAEYNTALETQQDKLRKYNDATTTYNAAYTAWENEGKPTESGNKYYEAQKAAATAKFDAYNAWDEANRNQARAKSSRDYAEVAYGDAVEDYKAAFDAFGKAEEEKISAENAAREAAEAAEAAKADEGTVLYTPRAGSGQITCFTTSITAGVNYALTDGLFLGLEFSPYTFYAAKLSVCPQGNRTYQAVHYANRFFTSPLLKIGFRF